MITRPEVVAALAKLFHNKCAYCETGIAAPGPSNVCHYRPAEGAIGSEGRFFPDHYWWTAYEWDNLHLACTECMRLKGHRFPVDGRRASAIGGLKGIGREKPMLLDPCRDEPLEHLVFNRRGKIVSATRRGRATIEILGLNRSALVRERRLKVDQVDAALRRARPLLRGRPSAADVAAIERELGELTEPSTPFAAAAQYLVGTWRKRLPARLRRLLDEGPETALDEVRRRSKHIAEPGEQNKTSKGYEEFERSLQDYSLHRHTHADRYYTKARLIERVEIENFRGIGNLSLHVAVGETYHGPWTMLLGENGTGKSSVLQAIALTLTGMRERKLLDVSAEQVLRSGASGGSVRVFLTGEPEPVVLQFTKKGFESPVADPRVLLLGYGSTRLLPRRGQTTLTRAGVSRVRNLFNPFLALEDANAWFSSLDRQTFDNAARSVKDLLALDDKVAILKEGSSVRVRAYGTTVKFSELSDGYQSTLALAADIMKTMLERWPDMKVAEGLVLIDELESHLHPSWKMQIVTSLRRCFPRIQFFASTHDPLCLRGLEAGEVVVVRRNRRGDSVAVTDLPSVKGMRVDQLLTSEHFGLSSTLEPDTELEFREYYDLLATPKRSAEEQKRLQALRQKLAGESVLGASPRDMMILQTVDEYVAAAREARSPSDRLELKDATKKQIKNLWASV